MQRYGVFAYPEEPWEKAVTRSVFWAIYVTVRNVKNTGPSVIPDSFGPNIALYFPLKVGLDAVVGTATRYGMDGPGIEAR
jgi:hypothetical protein